MYFQKLHFVSLVCLLSTIVLLLLASRPSTVAGQEPVGPTPEATVTPTPSTIYLPLIQSNLCSAIPPVPIPETPLPDAVITATQPITFHWSPADHCAGQSHYSLQIATAMTFHPDSIVHAIGYQGNGNGDEGQPYPDTSYQLLDIVPGLYYWRVSAFRWGRASDWSEPRRLTVISSPGNQLLINPSFEAYLDGVDPWFLLTPDMTYHPGYDPQVAHEGQQYLVINRQNEARGNKSFYQEIEQPQADQTYHFAIWVRASEEAVQAGKPRTGRIDLWAHGGTAPREHSTRNFQVNDTQWHCVETRLKVTDPAHAYLRAEVYLTSLDPLDYYFDHATLTDDSQPVCPPAPPDDGGTLISQEQGFDTCAAPEVSQLAAWGQASPYDYLGIYLGGANHYSPCRSHNQQHQTAAWYAAVSQQGWQFIPIWVGPQAPCTAYNIRFSSDSNTAWSEGKAEARVALARAAELGLLSPWKQRTIIYYDLEAYPTIDTTCHNAAKAFLEGWVSQLQNSGHKAGVYSLARIVNDWYRLKHVPDSVWAPWYIGSGYDPTMAVDQLNQRWISESYWDNYRLFQYSNSHDEGWGGVQLNIDNDTANGLVALKDTLASDEPVLHALDLLTPQQGWVWLNQRLFWSDTGGAQWAEITPPAAGVIRSVFFLDTSHGWVVSTPAGNSSPALWRTADGGQTWQNLALTIEDEDLLASSIYLDFIDPSTGWLVVKLPTSINFSQGLLFKTGDGGATWTQLTIPLGEPVRFITEQVGWTAGGPTKSELYVTGDGGQSWQAQTIVPQDPANGYLTYELPTFENPQEGAIAITIGQAGQTYTEFYVTRDGGQSWHLADKTALEQKFALGTRPPVHILNSHDWVVTTAKTSPPFPRHTVALDLASATVGWAHSRDYICAGPCEVRSRLFQTTDGGQTWIEVELPEMP